MPKQVTSFLQRPSFPTKSGGRSACASIFFFGVTSNAIAAFWPKKKEKKKSSSKAQAPSYNSN